MTSAERIEAALEGKALDRLPWCPFLAYVWEHFPKEIQDRGQRRFLEGAGADPLWRGAPCPTKSIPPPAMKTHEAQEGDLKVLHIDTPVGSIRMGWRYTPVGNTTFLVEHPLKRREDFAVQRWIEANTRIVPNDDWVERHFAGDGQVGLSLGMLIPRGKSAFQQLIEHHVGTEAMAFAMADFPEEVEALWQVMVERDLEAARIAATSAYRWFITWEDSSTQNYSPRQYRRFIDAELRQLMAIIGETGKRYIQHACGHLHDLLPMMKVSGAWAVESLSPKPTGNVLLSEARAVLGNQVGIVGGIEPTRFLGLTDAEFETDVAEVIKAGLGGPFVLANSDSCPPGVPPARFKRVGEIVRAWGPIAACR
jgi:hypothetical protein